ncbi:hypothetical protein MTO96_014639 [Rhipicephalus appendiculatus]
MGCTQSAIQRRAGGRAGRGGPATPVPTAAGVPPSASDLSAATNNSASNNRCRAPPSASESQPQHRNSRPQCLEGARPLFRRATNWEVVTERNVPLFAVLDGAPDDGRKGTVALKFGSMYLTVPSVKVMFVFGKEDAQYNALKWAADKMHYECTLSSTSEAAIDNYLNGQPHLVFVDARSKSTIDPVTLCRTLRGFRGSQFTCIIAVVKKGLADKEEAAVIPLLKCGYNRWFAETCSLGVCLNEMIQIEHNDLINLWKLRASEALFSALHYARDGVIVTGAAHEIQYMNRAAEKLVGYSVEEMLGVDAQELHRTDSLKTEVATTICTQLKKGKEWEGTLFHKRKSGECIPMWSKIAPRRNSHWEVRSRGIH